MQRRSGADAVARSPNSSGCSSSTPFPFPAEKEREATDSGGTSPSVITSTLTLRDLVPDASVDTWRPDSTFMDRPLDLSDVWERRQVMTAQMAAHQCLAKMLTDMGHASPERLIDRIYSGLHLDILTGKQAQHLKKLNSAPNVLLRRTVEPVADVEPDDETLCGSSFASIL